MTKQYVDDEPIGLPNTVREALLQQKLTCVVRTLEGLRQQGIQPGQTFSESHARDLLAGVVGSHSIRKTLVADICPKNNSVAKKTTTKSLISKCFEIIQTKPKLIQRGRHTHIYIMPSNIELTETLGVNMSRISDPLSQDDLASAKGVRQAMHREFLSRKPGIYPSKWLAQRLGISIMTKNRYDNAIPIYKTPTYKTYPITWDSCGMLDELEDEKGVFLEDQTGKRYPPKVDIAKQVLKRGRGGVLRIRSYNFYSTQKLPALPVEEPETALLHRWQPVYTSRLVTVPPLERTKRHFSDDYSSTSTLPTTDDLHPLFKLFPEELTKPVKMLQESYKVPLPYHQDEQLAQQIHTVIDQESFSLKSARRLIDRYGGTAVRYALDRVKTKRQVSNPAGLLTVIARSYQYL